MGSLHYYGPNTGLSQMPAKIYQFQNSSIQDTISQNINLPNVQRHVQLQETPDCSRNGVDRWIPAVAGINRALFRATAITAIANS